MEEVEEARLAGVDLNEYAGEQDVGGWAAEMMYLRHRYLPEPHAMGQELDNFYERTLEPKVERLEQLVEPSDEDHAAFRLALKVQHDHKRHGPPNAGGRRDQPAWWLCVHDAVETAAERAEASRAREEAAVNRQVGSQS